MTPLVFLLLCTAGGLGAGLRYAVDLLVVAATGARFPWGTLVVNVTGSFALGVLAGAVTDVAVLGIVGTGLLGGYTTFSSVANASGVLLGERRWAAGILNVLGTLALAVAAAAGGLALGAILGG